MVKEKKLTEVKHWENLQGEIQLHLSDDDPIKIWLNNNFHFFDQINNCFEIGCYPGKLLTIFADRGIEINGIDYVPQTRELKEAFLANSVKVGDIICADLFETNIGRKFDCVCSFGFIEHFINWEEVFNKHIELVNNNGYIILECPNYCGIYQKLPKYLFDRKNLKRHNLSSTNLAKWCEILNKNNFKIVYADYFGGYAMWFIKQCHNKWILFLRKLVVRVLTALVQIQKKGNHKSFSSFMGIIAIKN